MRLMRRGDGEALADDTDLGSLSGAEVKDSRVSLVATLAASEFVALDSSPMSLAADRFLIFNSTTNSQNVLPGSRADKQTEAAGDPSLQVRLTAFRTPAIVHCATLRARSVPCSRTSQTRCGFSS